MSNLSNIKWQVYIFYAISEVRPSECAFTLEKIRQIARPQKGPHSD